MRTSAESLKAFRLVKRRWAASAFDGEGAKLHGGRWNSRGVAAVYLASSESLAILEVLVHLENTAVLKHYALFQLQLQPADVVSLGPKELPQDWREDPAPVSTALIGDEWLRRSQALALVVPSTIVPRENNYLINPQHPKFSSLIESATELEFSPDPRL